MRFSSMAGVELKFIFQKPREGGEGGERGEGQRAERKRVRGAAAPGQEEKEGNMNT